MVKQSSPLSKALSGKASPGKQTVIISIADPNSTPVKELKKVVGTLNGSNAPSESPLVKSILNILNGDSNDSIERLSFEKDPTITNEYQSLFYSKTRLLPDSVLKRIAIQDDLVAAIVAARGNQIAAFGRPQPDRFSTGFKIDPKAGVLEDKDEAYKQEVQNRIEKARDILSQCGRVRGWSDAEKMTLSQFLYQQTRNAVILGRFATEIIYVQENGERKFHSFRPIDAGTIYKATPQTKAADQVRKQARLLLEQLKNEKFAPEKMEHDEYAYVQVIEGRPVQAFGPEECVVHNVYPVTDIELCGYPLTPIDTMIAAVTTHINITTHNKLYFQAGRAARGMLIIKSEDVSPAVVSTVRQQFNASINSVNNAWRMPVFGIGKDDEITWAPIDNSSRDMEFQYLSDSNARVILSAFQMSPEELPGYAHLCLDPHTLVWTGNGVSTIASILEGKKVSDSFKVWTGTGLSDAVAFVTGKRKVHKTTTDNGITLTTSPEHRFRIVNEKGELDWKQQKDLVIGDTLLVNRKPVPGSEEFIPSYNGRKLTKDMMEVLGWLTGDGSIGVAKRGKNKHSKNLEFYYHHDKEPTIRERHFDILTQFGLAPKKNDKTVSVAQVEKQKELFGFKSVSNVKRLLNLYDTQFVEFLLDLGFNPSTQEKAIPNFIHSLPVEYRGSFLKGFFSADGSIDKLNTPSITIASDSTRESTKLLLLNMGIRTRFCEGTTKTSITKDGAGYSKKYIKKASRLIVKDKLEFFERIGFLQIHKQPNLEAIKNSDRRWDKVARSVVVKFADSLINKLTGHINRDRIRHMFKDPKYPYQNLSKLVKIAQEYNETLPDWLSEYYQEPVVDLVFSNEEMDMVDIEVFDSEHAFIANGILVHNSRGTNSQALSESNSEYKLEAARDVGIRPLLSQFQDFLNSRIFPLIDENLANLCVIKLVGLDAETAEKESVRLQQDMVIHMDYDEVREKVEKEPLGADWGGELPLNPTIWEYINSLFTVGEILEKFCGRQGASKRPELAYRRDQFWFSQVQVMQANQQMQMQQQQAQQQQAGAQPQPGQSSGDKPPDGSPDQKPSPEGSAAPGQGSETDLTRGLDQLVGLLTKSEKQLSPSKRRVLAQQKALVSHTMKQWEVDRNAALASIMDTVEHFVPKL